MATCDRLDELMPSVRVHKIDLLHRTRMKQALYTMSEPQNPIIASLETWGLCIRYAEYLRQGQGRSFYGENQDIAVAGAVEIQNEFELIAKELLKPDVYESTRKQLMDFAKRNPIKGTFSDMIVYATAAQPGVPSAFAKIASVPMAPFKAVEGIDKTATAIYGVKQSADRFSDIVEDLPESVKWQVLLLLLDVQEIESVKTFSNNISKISESTAKFADAAENLPEKLRQQTSILAKEIDARQANLQVTLEKAQKTAVSLEQVFSQADKTLQTMNTAAGSINDIARNWESAAKATDETIQSIRDWSNEPRKANAPPAMTVRDYKDILQEVTKTSAEIRMLTADVSGLESKVVGLTDHITWRLIQLILLIFMLTLAYKIIIKYWISK